MIVRKRTTQTVKSKNDNTKIINTNYITEKLQRNKCNPIEEIYHLNNNEQERFIACFIFDKFGAYNRDHDFNYTIHNRNILHVWRSISNSKQKRLTNKDTLAGWMREIQTHHQKKGNKIIK